MSYSLEEQDGKENISARNITNLWSAVDIDALAEEEHKLEALVDSLYETCSRLKMETSTEKAELITNCANGIPREVKVKGEKLLTVSSFKYNNSQLSQMIARNRWLSKGLHKPLQLLQIVWIKGKTDALPCHFHIYVCLWIMDLDNLARGIMQSLWDATEGY